MSSSFVLHGDSVWCAADGAFECRKNSFLVCDKGVCAGVFSRLPACYAALPFIDYQSHLIMPGLVDLHTHAPQFAFRALGMDKKLLEWLTTCAFPEEAKYHDLEYAARAYTLFVDELVRGPATRHVIFATVHKDATLLLMDILEKTGLVAFVGKVNMDRHSPPSLCEASAAASIDATREWLDSCAQRAYSAIKPILTPRFIPSCSDDLMRGLRLLHTEYNVPVQSHLSENPEEIAWVHELCPHSASYGGAYADFGLLGADIQTVMAHCVWPEEHEISLLAERGVFIAHCPESNCNLASGCAPVRRLLNAGVRVGLGSDIAGGTNSSIFRAMSSAIQISKVRHALLEPRKEPFSNERPLTIEEVFFAGTAAGGAFFGKAGSFEAGYEFDALVLDDSTAPLASTSTLSLRDRLERVIYLADDRHIRAKYAQGRCIYQKPPLM
ncbi:MAG: amidohydrolase family protein [Spirochaetaceae bacterium]|jgi:guanine deaminase|nr:amidohydrolase family protein [Spirochaetaceae bacterium]